MKVSSVEFGAFEVKFEFNKKVIVPAIDQCIRETPLFVIFQTNFSEYFVKVYRSADQKTNRKLADSFVKTANTLYTASHLNPRVHNVISVGSFVAVLIDSYLDDLGELLKLRPFQTHFEFYQLVYQVCTSLQYLLAEEVEGFRLRPESIVLNHQTNYKLLHLDDRPGALPESANLESAAGMPTLPLAPEYFKIKKYVIESNLWDLGCLLHYILTGKSPEVDLEGQRVTLHTQTGKCSQLLQSIIEEMLAFSPTDRTKPEELTNRIREAFAGTPEPQWVKVEDPIWISIKGYVFSIEHEVNHRYYEDFPGHQATFKQGMSLVDVLAQTLNPNCMLSDESIKKLILDGWKSQERHIKFYMELKDRLPLMQNNLIGSLKVLMTLHSYIFRSPRTCLAVFMKDGTTNVVELILETLLKSFQKVGDPDFLSYCGLLLKKVQFHFRHIKVIENNGAISKMWFLEMWKETIGFAFVRDLCNQIGITAAVFLRFKRFRFNYFSKNCLLFVSKELVNLIALLSNVLCFILYLRDKVGLGAAEGKTIDTFTDFLGTSLENVRLFFTESLRSMAKRDFRALEGFIVDQDLKQAFWKLKMQMRNDQNPFSLLEFISVYLNKVMRIPDSYENRELKIDPKQEVLYKDAKVAKEALTALAKSIQEAVTVKANLFVVPEMVKTDESGTSKIAPKEAGEAKQGPSGPVDPPNFTKELKIALQPKLTADFGIQTDIAKEEAELRKEEEMLKGADKSPGKPSTPRESHAEQKISMREEFINLGKSEQTLDTQDGLEKFLLSVFARSVDEWIVNYNDIVFENQIANGSTCLVFRGAYRNLPVAIKKLTQPDNEAKIKFLKEFKREISLLVSLPNHPSLLTMIGFSLKNNEVYLLTEYCEGGTLFDILYKRKNPSRLN